MRHIARACRCACSAHTAVRTIAFNALPDKALSIWLTAQFGAGMNGCTHALPAGVRKIRYTNAQSSYHEQLVRYVVWGGGRARAQVRGLGPYTRPLVHVAAARMPGHTYYAFEFNTRQDGLVSNRSEPAGSCARALRRRTHARRGGVPHAFAAWAAPHHLGPAAPPVTVLSPGPTQRSNAVPRHVAMPAQCGARG